MRLVPIGIFISLALLLGSLLYRQSMPDAAASRPNTPFPAMTVTAIDGKKPWKQAALEGHVTFINFFASWCSPCAEEMPELALLKKQFPNVQFMGVAWNDTPPIIKKWLAAASNPFETVWIDRTGDATMALGIKGIPESFIVDGKGMVRYRLSGILTPGMRNGEVGALLTELLNEAPVGK